jgi:hypothetical protein
MDMMYLQEYSSIFLAVFAGLVFVLNMQYL